MFTKVIGFVDKGTGGVIALAGFGVGVLIGLTGIGGGALMTPVLILVFGVSPLAAVSSDVVASLVMKPIGGGIHLRRGTVNLAMVAWLAAGSVPCAFTAAWIVSTMDASTVESNLKHVLGVVLLVACAAMVARRALLAQRPSGAASAEPLQVRPLPTVVIGMLGGTVVGLTSVGAGTLMIVLLMMLYPALSSRELVGTDLVQAVPLVAAAAAGHLLFGDFELSLTGTLLLGAVPGVIVGAHFSSREQDGWIRPVLVVVLATSALKLLGAPTSAVAGIVVCVGVAAGGWLAYRRWSSVTVRRERRVGSAAVAADLGVVSAADTPRGPRAGS